MRQVARQVLALRVRRGPQVLTQLVLLMVVLGKRAGRGLPAVRAPQVVRGWPEEPEAQAEQDMRG